jgi:phosphatidylglycerophosphate synthase
MGEIRSSNRPWLAAYKATLKDPEDLLDLAFNRFPAYLLVRAAAPLKISPNALTAVSFLLTCVSAWLFTRGRLALAGLIVYLKVVFDCSDGQMARFTGKASPHGRLYDELADISGQFLIFGGLGYALLRTGFDWGVFGGLAFSLGFMGADITVFQNFRAFYLRLYENRAVHATPPATERGFLRPGFAVIRGLDVFRDWTRRIVPLPDINAYAAENGWNEGRKEELRAAFRRRFKPVVSGFSLAAGTSHLFAIVVLAVIGRIEAIIPLFILWYNLFVLALVAFQVANAAAFKRRYMPRIDP